MRMPIPDPRTVAEPMMHRSCTVTWSLSEWNTRKLPGAPVAELVIREAMPSPLTVM